MEIQAYRRKDGSVGIRNHLLVMPSVVCANNVVQKIAAELNGAVSIHHKNGCAEITDEDRERVRRTLIGYAANPNVGACLIIGLGCEDTKAETLAAEIRKTGKRAEFINIQDTHGTNRTIREGIAVGKAMQAELQKEKRTSCQLKEIILGLECGGSDTFSGITANPSMGIASDKFISCGGTAVLSETPEHMGGEHILLSRMPKEETKRKFNHLLDIWGDMQQKEKVSCNFISLGNMEGGLSTLEEKSLGCILKAGTSAISDVVDYAEHVQEKGIVIMDTPGTDIESMTGMAAGGAQIICFSSGRGTPTACAISPTIKIASNPDMYQCMEENMDINAGRCISEGVSIEEIGEEIFREIVAVCNGKLTKSEILGFGDFAVSTKSFTY